MMGKVDVIIANLPISVLVLWWCRQDQHTAGLLSKRFGIYLDVRWVEQARVMAC